MWPPDRVFQPMMTRLLLVVLAFTFIMVSPVAMSRVEAAENSVIGLRLGSVTLDADRALRVVVETKNPSAAQLTLLSDPYRLVIDMPSTDWQVNGIASRGPLSKSPATAYRFGQPRPGIGRIVIELDAPAAPVRRLSLPPGDGGHRLVLDLVDRGETAFQLAARALGRETVSAASQPASPTDLNASEQADQMSGAERVDLAVTPVPPPSRQQQATPTVSIATPSTKPRKWIVFIDAGHGGKDPGAIGRAKTLEKDITLAAAIELARQLDATGVVQPILSRKDDRYLKLRQRIALAREQEADLFISLHADAAPSSKAEGMSVFTLSDKASDREAELIAMNENRADLIGGPDLAVEDPDAAGELLRMFQRESMNQSTYLASSILKQIRDMPGGDRRGHRFAGFAVLKAPDMPSVLVEMGFLTNRRDEANLNKPAYRSKLVERLARAIIAYLVEYGPRS